MYITYLLAPNSIIAPGMHIYTSSYQPQQYTVTTCTIIGIICNYSRLILISQCSVKFTTEKYEWNHSGLSPFLFHHLWVRGFLFIWGTVFGVEGYRLVRLGTKQKWGANRRQSVLTLNIHAHVGIQETHHLPQNNDMTFLFIESCERIGVLCANCNLLPCDKQLRS